MIKSCSLAFGLLCGVTFAGPAALAQASTYKVLYSFSSASPAGGVIKVGSRLYGVGSVGDAYGVYSLNPSTGTVALVHDFQNGPFPSASLLDVNGTLFGVTSYGGNQACPSGCGSIFSLNLKTGVEQTVYAFQGGTDGDRPEASLININGVLYGTTEGGAKDCKYNAGQCGTVFSLNPTTTVEQVLYSFQGFSNGAYPAATLLHTGTKLFGTTQADGADNAGTIFSLNLKTGAEEDYHYFGYQQNGQFPASAGLINVGGTFYGTTSAGGVNGHGIIYAFDPKTFSDQILYSFQGGSDGSAPFTGLTNIGATLYGTTFYGGSCSDSEGCGTVFSLNTSTGAYQVLHVFQGGTDGSNPAATLLNVHGTLYGTATSGGSSNNGTVFALTP